MEITLLGSNTCQVCQQLEQSLFNVLAELGVAADVDKIDDVDKMMEYDIMALPGLIINGEVKVKGRVPSKAELTAWISAASS